MKTNALFLALLSTAALFAQTTPPALTADTIPFRAVLLPGTAVPAALAATGAATILVHVVRDASGNVVSGSIDTTATTAFSGTTNVNGLVIQKGTAGNTGATVIDTGLNGTNAVAVDATGKSTITRQTQFGPAITNGPALSDINDLIANPQNYYVNLQTSDNPLGAVRGQLVRADMIVLMGLMSPANEVPPIAGSTASGVATVIVYRTLDSKGALSSAVATLATDYTGFPANTSLTGFHIHNGAAGVAGPVTINTGIGGGANAVASPTGAGSLGYDVEVNVSNAAAVTTVNNLFADPSQTYINLHNAVNPGGEIRAQLRRTDKTVFPVQMLPSNETPPIPGLNASAPAAISVYTLRNDDGTAAAGTVIFDVDPRFPANTTFTGLHIHDGAAGVSGPVTINTGLSSATSVSSDSGQANFYKIVTVSSGAALNTLNAILKTPALTYVNLHTTVYPAGAVRSQLATASTAVATVGGVFSNAAATATLAPGSIVSIYGQNLAPSASDTSGFATSTLPNSINGVSVTIGGMPAQLYYVSPTQINLLVPANLPLGAQPVVVTTTNGASTAFTATLKAAAPALYVINPATSQGAIQKNSDFSLIGPGNPAKEGDILVIYSTGLGATTPVTINGTSFNQTATATVTLGGITAPVVYSIASPQYPGLYQTAITVPAGVHGTVPVILNVGTGTSNTVYATVQ